MSAALDTPAEPPMTAPSTAPTAASPLRRIFEKLGYTPHSAWAWANYEPSIIALSQELGLKRHLEIGGGRDPRFSAEEAARLGFDITVNDISPVELEHAPAGVRTACFDISGDIGQSGIAPGGIDIAYSLMVFEHVRDVRRAWANIHTLLAPGGVGIAFHPTLYAAPFVVNKLIPESISSRLVARLYKHRTATEDPKFPAHYDWCYAEASIMEPMLRGIGFSDVAILPFYGHDYFRKLPILREVDDWISGMARSRNIARLAAYSYTVVRK